MSVETDDERRRRLIGPSAGEIDTAAFMAERREKRETAEQLKAEAKRAELRLKRPKVWTAAELIATDFPEPRWIVPGFIPEGFAILAGVPKLGKSWMALNLAIAVATGGRFLGSVEVDQVGVLLISREDTPSRLKNRFAKLGFTGSELLHIATDWPKGKLAVEQLDLFLDDNPGIMLVIVDTLARIIDIEDSRDYLETYEAVGALKHVADSHATAIVAIHHVGKAQRDDWVQTLMDSTGYGAAAITLMAATRKRGQVDAVLKVTGRDIEERELALSFDQDICTWKLLGDAFEIQETRERQELVDYLSANGPMKSGELAKALQRSAQATSNMLVRLEKDGVVHSPNYGKWEVVKLRVSRVGGVTEKAVSPNKQVIRPSEDRRKV